jgi:hypothetical protein
MVSRELLSSAVDRILDLPTARSASFRSNLLRPASFIFQDRRSTPPLGTYSVMSERGLRS